MAVARVGGGRGLRERAPGSGASRALGNRHGRGDGGLAPDRGSAALSCSHVALAGRHSTRTSVSIRVSCRNQHGKLAPENSPHLWRITGFWGTLVLEGDPLWFAGSSHSGPFRGSGPFSTTGGIRVPARERALGRAPLPSQNLQWPTSTVRRRRACQQSNPFCRSQGDWLSERGLLYRCAATLEGWRPVPLCVAAPARRFAGRRAGVIRMPCRLRERNWLAEQPARIPARFGWSSVAAFGWASAWECRRRRRSR